MKPTLQSNNQKGWNGLPESSSRRRSANKNFQLANTDLLPNYRLFASWIVSFNVYFKYHSNTSYEPLFYKEMHISGSVINSNLTTVILGSPAKLILVPCKKKKELHRDHTYLYSDHENFQTHLQKDVRQFSCTDRDTVPNLEYWRRPKPTAHVSSPDWTQFSAKQLQLCLLISGNEWRQHQVGDEETYECPLWFVKSIFHASVGIIV